MSFSVTAKIKYPEGLVNNLEHLRAVDRSTIGNAQCEHERDELIEAAVGAVGELLEDVSFENADEIAVTISGHANPGHTNADGYANEYVSITLSVQSYREKAA